MFVCLFIIFFVVVLVVLSLRCCTGFSLVAESGGYSPAALLTAVVSLIAEQVLQDMWALVDVVPRLQSTGSAAVAHGPRGYAARAIFLDQESNRA